MLEFARLLAQWDTILKRQFALYAQQIYKAVQYAMVAGHAQTNQFAHPAFLHTFQITINAKNAQKHYQDAKHAKATQCAYLAYQRII